MRNKSAAYNKTKAPVKDYTVIKVMAALVMLVVTLLVLSRVRTAFSTLGGVERMLPLTFAGIIGCAACAAASVVLLIVKKGNKTINMICRYTLAFFLLELVTCLILRFYLYDQMILLYYLQTVSYLLYIIYMLYRTEFFAVSLVNCVAGWTFYRYFPGVELNGRVIGYGLALVAVAALTSLFAKKMSDSKGFFRLGTKKHRLLPQSFNPTFLYVCCGLWVVCLIASLLIGSLFAYYCIFAVIAVELIAAVYYTFKMK